MADLMQQARAELAVTARENMRKARALFDDNLIDAREVAGQFSDWLRVNAACQAEEFPEAAGQLSATAELIDRLTAALRAAPEGLIEQHARDSQELRRLCQSRDFYKRRCEALQAVQSSMRDPERKAVCDILANGETAVFAAARPQGVPDAG